MLSVVDAVAESKRLLYSAAKYARLGQTGNDRLWSRAAAYRSRQPRDAAVAELGQFGMRTPNRSFSELDYLCAQHNASATPRESSNARTFAIMLRCAYMCNGCWDCATWCHLPYLLGRSVCVVHMWCRWVGGKHYACVLRTAFEVYGSRDATMMILRICAYTKSSHQAHEERFLVQFGMTNPINVTQVLSDMCVCYITQDEYFPFYIFIIVSVWVLLYRNVTPFIMKTCRTLIK